MTVSGMTRVTIDPEGRLVALGVVPAELEKGPEGAGAAMSWKPLFDLADLDISRFTPVPPLWTPLEYADTRAAWTGPLPGVPNGELRVEAAAYRGKPVFFKEIMPWTRASRSPDVIAQRSHVSFLSILATAIIASLFLAGAVVAGHNIRRGRGDRRGALQLAVFVMIMAASVGLLTDKHAFDPNVELTRFLATQPLWAAGLLWIFYLALEPYVRRFWPTRVVSWSRLMARQWRDPLVGRDILVGIGIGVLVRVIDRGHGVTLAMRGHTGAPVVPELSQLLSASHAVAVLMNQMFNTLLNALIAVFALVLLKMLVRREWAVAVLAAGVPMIFVVASATDSHAPVLDVAAGMLTIGLYVFTIQRLGLLATVMLFLVSYTLSDAVLTFDTSRWFFGYSMLPVLMMAALACYGFYASRGGEPILGTRLLD